MSSIMNAPVQPNALTLLSTTPAAFGNDALLTTTLPGLDASLQAATFIGSSSAIEPTDTSTAVAPAIQTTGGSTLSSATNLGSLSGTQTIQDAIGVSTNRPNDYYRFTLDTTSNLNLVLTGLTADADLHLLNSAGTEVNFSERDGYTQDESINRVNLAAGTYYIRVNQYQGNTGFSLNLSTNALSNLLPNEFELNNVGVGGTVTQTGTINGNNASDTYHFFNTFPSSNLSIALTGLSADADLRVIRDANNNGIVDVGEEIDRSAFFGTASESLNLQGLGTGSYFIQVYQYSGNTNYTLTLQGSPGVGSATGFINQINSAYDIGTLNGSRQFGGEVSRVTSFSDSQDFYRFNLGTTSNFSLSLTGLSTNADVQVIRDANNNGLVDVGEVIAYANGSGINPEFLELQGLGAGDYLVRVYQAQANASTNYSLTLQATPGLGLPGAPGYFGGFGGTLNGSREYSGSISDRRTEDWYWVTLGTASNFNLNLDGLTGNLNVQLYYDSNGNGNAEAGELIATSTRTGSLSEFINLQGLTAGQYFVRVAQATGATGNSVGDYSNYVLNLQATPLGTSLNPTYGTPGQAYNLGFLNYGNLGNSRSVNGFVNSSDPQDYYYFAVDRSGSLNLSLDRLSADADVQLFSSNGTFIASSTALGSSPERIITSLAAGGYYVRVYQAVGNTDYTANLSFSPY